NNTEITDEIKENIAKNKFPVEADFLTTINPIGTEDEIIKNNNLIASNERISVQERLKAKNVAENFVQAIISIDKSKPEQAAERAKKYVVPEKKKEIEDLYIFLGKNQNEKAYLVDEISSYEEKNKEENDYVYFNVYTNAVAIDQYDQKVSFGRPTYNVQLLKLDGKWQVVQYNIN
ncbi:hypothetical protein, partial [Clostridium tarantellae]|uniref:hypothetical protein n=1 Tax=Clostridium tarantellae TaxID=39493 RepID=UPI0014784FED